MGIKSGAKRSVPPEVLGGFDKVETGTDAVWKGVSGKKIVIEL